MKRIGTKVVIVLSMLGLGSACASTSVRTVETDISGPLPRPDRVLVYDFAVSPDEVQLDSGLSARAEAAMKGTPRTAQELQVGLHTADALSEELVKQIRKLGLDAERADGPVEQRENDLAIGGYFISIDEGNRTERVVIGLGAGRTDVQAEAFVRQNGLVVEQLATDAKSGVKPGMAETMGAGAAAGDLAASAAVSAGVAGVSEAFGANVEADASRTASKLAKQLEAFFVRKAWIPE